MNHDKRLLQINGKLMELAKDLQYIASETDNYEVYEALGQVEKAIQSIDSKLEINL